MGLTASSLSLTEYDIEDVQQHCDGKFSGPEIQALYQRFRALDKKHKGFITEDELMAIPELAISRSPRASCRCSRIKTLRISSACSPR